MDQQPLANIFAWLRAWISKLNEESFAKISAGIQSIVTALGIVVGGGWVLYTFGELGAVQKSRAEIAALEHQAIQEPVLLVDIKVDPTKDVNNGRRPTRIVAVFHNDGKKALKFKDTTLQIAKLLDNSEAIDSTVRPYTLTPHLLNQETGKLEAMGERILRSGQARTLAFIVPSLSPGIYFVQLDSVYYGMDIIDGQFVVSSDEPILATEQTTMLVPRSTQVQPEQTIGKE